MTSAAHHNRVLEAAERRALRVEDRLVEILAPILNGAGIRAASRFSRLAGVSEAHQADVAHLAAAGRAGSRALMASLALRGAGPDVQSSSAMVALTPRYSEAETIGGQAGLPAETLHVTLVYLGEVDEGVVRSAVDALRLVAGSHAPLEGAVGGVGVFGDNGKGHPAIALPSVPGLVELRVDVTDALVKAGVDFARNHGYQPHMTLDYLDELAVPAPSVIGEPLHFDSIQVIQGDRLVADLPLTGARPLTAAAPPGPPSWDPPAGDELVDVDALTDRLRTKTDPVRRATIETTMKSTLGGAGIDYDTTNPFTAKVLSQSASQIKEIAQTTQLNVMRTIAAAYDKGLSIPDTATAIRAGMSEASAVRARLIARTELAGAVNGGSVAATQIVSEATGVGFNKVWLTAPGAPHPRHELYEGLDQQVQPLDGFFTVGDAALQFPGDPDGPPEEVCNCRCTVIYQETAPGAELPDEELPDGESIGTVEPDQTDRVEGDILGWGDEEASDVGLAALNTSEPDTVIQALYDAQGAAQAIVTTFPSPAIERVIVPELAATGGTGAGTRLLQHVAGRASDKGYGLRLISTPDSEGYYDKIGFDRIFPSERDIIMDLPPDRAADFAKNGRPGVKGEPLTAPSLPQLPQTPEPLPPSGVRVVRPDPGPDVGVTGLSREGLGNSETLRDQSSATRGTGHFGTGTYFVSDVDKLASFGGEARETVGIDLRGLNLYRPPSVREGEDLHRALAKVDDLVAHPVPDLLEDSSFRAKLDRLAESIPGANSETIYEALLSARDDLTAARTNTDSAATRVMKALGYDGVDVRGLEGLDGTQFGSVVYRADVSQAQAGAGFDVPGPKATAPVETMNVEDVKRYGLLWESKIEDSYDTIHPYDREILNALQTPAFEPGAEVSAIVEKGDVMAAAAWRVDPDGLRVFHIGTVGKGRAEQMMKKLVADAEERHLPIRLTPGPHTRDFYERFGFKPDGLYPDQMVRYVDVPKGDPVSVAQWPFVDGDVLKTVKAKGLDEATVRESAYAKEILGGAKDTEAVYFHDGVWDEHRVATVWAKIIEEHFKGKTAAGELRALYTSGGGASGKTSLRFTVDGKELSLKEIVGDPDKGVLGHPNFIAINPDDIKEMLPEYQTLHAAGDPYAASAVHEESSAIAKAIQKLAFDQHYSILVDKTGSSGGFVKELTAVKGQGYHLQVSMASAPINRAIERNILRGDKTGRYLGVPGQKAAHKGASANFMKWSKMDDVVDQWQLVDTTDIPNVVVARAINGQIEILDQARYEAILRKAYE